MTIAFMTKINWRIPLAFLLAPALMSALLTLITTSITNRWNEASLFFCVALVLLEFSWIILGGPIYLVLKRFRTIDRLECVLSGLSAGIIFSVLEFRAGIAADASLNIMIGSGTGYSFWLIAFWQAQPHTGQFMSAKKLLTKRKFLRSGIITAITILSIFWLGEKIVSSKIQDSMYVHLNTGLDKRIDKVECYAEAVGEEFRPEFARNYHINNSPRWAVKYIDIQNDVHPPVWAFEPNQVDLIFFDRESPPKLLYQIHSNGIEKEALTRSNEYWMDALADAIVEGQPR
jgi:hypothetical protein